VKLVLGAIHDMKTTGVGSNLELQSIMGEAGAAGKLRHDTPTGAGSNSEGAGVQANNQGKNKG